MRREERTFNNPTNPGPSDPILCGTWVDKWVGLDNFTGTITIEGQLLSTGGFATVATVDATAGLPAFVEVKPLFYAVRINTTGATGTPSAAIVALDRRTAE